MAEIDQLTQPDTQGSYVDDWRERAKRAFFASKTKEDPPLEPQDSAGVKREKPNSKGSRSGASSDDEETVRRRDILVSVAVLGELEQYVGENIPPAKIRTMSKAKLDTLYAAYEAKLGQEITENGMEPFVGTAVKAISWLVPIGDQDALRVDLMENKPLRRSLGRYCAGVAERWGDLVAFAKVGYDVFKHVGAPPLEPREATPNESNGKSN